MSEHTPVPWTLRRLPSAIIAIEWDTRILATVLPGADLEEAQANADLIVQAVNCHEELLEACKKMLLWYGGMADDAEVSDGARHAADAAKAAIAKAKET